LRFKYPIIPLKQPDRARRRADQRRPSASAPHLAKPDGDIDPGSGACGVPMGGGGRRRAIDAGKQTEDFLRQKARSRYEDVTTTKPVLLGSMKPLRPHEIKVFPRARHPR
jgi:hypothetical protein